VRSQRRDGKPIAVQTHPNALKGVKAFFKWAVSRRYVTQNRSPRSSRWARPGAARRSPASTRPGASSPSRRPRRWPATLRQPRCSCRCTWACARRSQHYADPSTVANRTLRKVADVLSGSDRPDLDRLLALLRDRLTPSELATLGQG
jgi:hypothetical protein